MSAFRVSFDSPGFLWLLLLLVPLWWANRSVRVLGRWRSWIAMILRSLVVTSLILALAGIQLVRISERVTVLYLLDQSESIPAAKRQIMLDYVVQSVRKHRVAARADRAGIIVFGREASIEIPPFDDDIPALRGLESYLGRTDATNLESALKLAQATMQDDSARRIVIVSDGNENLGNAEQIVARLADNGVGIDVVPVELNNTSEVLVEKIDLPPQVRKGQPIEARVVISNYAEGNDQPVTGEMVVTREIGGVETIIAQESVTLKAGTNVFPLTHQVGPPAPYTYRAKFIPSSPSSDSLTQNNEATGYTYVRGSGRVLLIEDSEKPGDFEPLINRLREADIEVQVQPNDQLFRSIAELQAFDAVILAGVPRVSGDSATSIGGFSDAQIEMLVRNTQQLGAGLLMIGGPDALGAGGWIGTELEKAMPVDFQIPNTKVQAVGALAIILHASEIAQGNYWQQVIARAAVEALGPNDYAGVLVWGPSGDEWLWGRRLEGMLPVGPNRRSMLAALGRMSPGDMPQFDPAMRMAVNGLNKTPASLKHCIIISDGDPSDPSSSVIQSFKRNNIKISTVAVAAHGSVETNRLSAIAAQTGGKFYAVTNPQALPQIFQREARRVARPLIRDIPDGVQPVIVSSHPILEGFEEVLPPITGFLLTQTKDNPLAQVLVRAPDSATPENSTILAVWNYGLGRTAVLTTDAGARWATSWLRSSNYDKFYTQLVRWLMRPTGDTGKYDLATRVENGRVEVVLSALDKDDSFLNFLDVAASVLGPDLQPVSLDLQQVAPGRYVGSFPVDQAGSYFVNVVPGPGQAPLSMGVTVPYSEEFRVREANRALLQRLTQVQPVGGTSGMVFSALGESGNLQAENPFRGGLPPARSIRDAWPIIALAACMLFFFDVFVRRVAIDFAWVGILVQKALGRGGNQTAVAEVRLQTLRARKEAIDQERRKASARFEPNPEITLPTEQDSPSTTLEGTTRNKGTRGGFEGTTREEKTYTERLLEAKRAARKKLDERGSEPDSQSGRNSQ